MLSYYGEVPKYDNWYYNSEQQIADIINFLQNTETNHLVLSEENFEITQRAIQQSIRLYSNLVSKSIHFVWFTIYEFETIEIFQTRIKNAFLEVLIRKDMLDEQNQLIKVLSQKFELHSLEENIQNDILPIIRKLFGETVVIYFDVKGSASYFPYEHSILIDILLNTNTTVDLKIISNTPFMNMISRHVLFNKFDAISSSNTAKKLHTTSEKLKIYTTLGDEIKTLKSLLLLQHPVNKISLDFIKKFIPLADNAIENLSYNELIYYLNNGGIAFDRSVITQTNRFQLESRDRFVSNSLKVLSFDLPESLMALTYDDRHMVEHIAPALSILSLGSAVTANTVNNNSKMAKWYNDALVEQCETNGLINIDNRQQIEVLVNYMSQILLLNKNLTSLLPLLQRISYLLAEYIAHLENEPNKNLLASRWIYKVGYIYDRLRNPNRNITIANTGQDIYKKSSNFIKDYINTPREDLAINAYRYATAEYHAGNSKKALEVFYTSSQILYREYLSEKKNGIFTKARYHAYELALMGLCIDKGSNYACIKDVINNFIQTNGITLSCDEFVKKLKNNVPINQVYPNDIYSNDIDVYIFYMNLDTYAAYIIAEYLYFYFNLSSKLILYQDKTSFDEELQKSENLSILIGAPDTPGGLGESISKLDPTLEHIYQLKMGENFNYPTLIKQDKYYLILCASGVGGIIDGWLSCVRRLTLENILNKKEKNMFESALDTFGLSFIGKAGGMLSEKIINKLLDKISPETTEERNSLNSALRVFKETSKLDLNKETVSSRSRNQLMEYTKINISLQLILEIIDTYREHTYIESKELKELTSDLIKVIQIVKVQVPLKKEHKDIVENFLDSISSIYQEASVLHNKEIANMDVDLKDLVKLSVQCLDTSTKLINFLLPIV